MLRSLGLDPKAETPTPTGEWKLKNTFNSHEPKKQTRQADEAGSRLAGGCPQREAQVNNMQSESME